MFYFVLLHVSLIPFFNSFAAIMFCHLNFPLQMHIQIYCFVWFMTLRRVIKFEVTSFFIKGLGYYRTMKSKIVTNEYEEKRKLQELSLNAKFFLCSANIEWKNSIGAPVSSASSFAIIFNFHAQKQETLWKWNFGFIIIQWWHYDWVL